MDFFEHQDRARRKTGQLVLLFLLGIVVTLVVVNLVCFVGFWLVYQPDETTHALSQAQVPSIFQSLLSSADISVTQRHGGFLNAWQRWWGSNLNWQISLGVLAAVVIGTVFRYLELAGGGAKVAQWAGAKAVDMQSAQPSHKQFVNICEEMSIAAGMPVPALYVMDKEQSINAFVAGYNAEDAVLVVTQGALDALSRDQLQGVIGHEYSHILNGDMRLNVRLMALLAGLVMVGQMGRFLMHAQFGHGYSHRRSSKQSIVFIAIGLVLTLVGYVGVLVSRMIKAAVSRQREFLADASSVQFTRNPDGLAGALYAIAEHQDGSQLRHQHAEDMSHFCFGETVALSDRLATHPPIKDRIKRIAPQFMAKEKSRRRREEPIEQSVQRHAPPAFETAIAATGLASMVANVTPDHVKYAQSLYQHIPEQLKNLLHQSDGARCFFYAQMMLANEHHQQQIVDLIKAEDANAIGVLQKMWLYCKTLDSQLRLPLLELVMPTLKRMPEPDRVVFVDRLERMVQLDGQVNFVEWLSLSMLKLKLRSKAGRSSKALSNKFKDYASEVRQVLALLVNVSPDQEKAQTAYGQVCTQLGIEWSAEQGVPVVAFHQLDSALHHLEGLSFMWRKVILQGAADIVQSDGEIAFAEYEALRVVADCLSSPLPPLMVALEEQDLRDQPIPFHS